LYLYGHFEYNTYTLKTEYERDLAKGLPIDLPVNYFTNNDPKQTHGTLACQRQFAVSELA
jgi:homoserine O-succinyltransferase